MQKSTAYDILMNDIFVFVIDHNLSALDDLFVYQTAENFEAEERPSIKSLLWWYQRINKNKWCFSL